MPDIKHQVGIYAPIDQVQASFTTLPGLKDFWTTTVDGDPGPGGTLRFYFGGPKAAAAMDVLVAEPRLVVWRCVEGPDEWLGTDFTFALSESDGATVLDFTNSGWREPVGFMGHCSTKWAYFLIGLKLTLEGATPVSFPNDLAIAAWEDASRAARSGASDREPAVS